ncbi:MAG: tRNA guanosine(34) transglycosylase Tgt [Bacteroidales bacterium]|jgi:queuine tRNA-ribosyltransferase|nr:tRNA guanosine(34) transglycosylase Tgt [Bacteroidales bacterium]MDD4383972.1 tRNA guanosine(34) transglycosylase Tgt [Bacteroidales bacterium]MDY0196377.1 tRNA guanosine(34) transglycosylase Tgt [Tenuifilaceae bacterium]
MNFTISKTNTDSNARSGLITTDHGEIPTPIFMPVGTVGSVKGINHRELENDINAKIILGNTYHLYLRPGLDVLSEAGGLHKFMSWNRPILTDSGGYQVFSLAANRKLKPDGAHFRSHIDGSKHIFSPEKVMDIQRIIGADIIMAFDECPPGDATFEYARKSLDLTENWLERCIKRFDETQPLYGHNQTLFPIVQGCVYPELRKRAAENIAKTNRNGYAIGGLSVGEPAEVMYQMIEVVNDILPKDKPRYLMGVGTPDNILEAIDRGVDMFDCVMPTRNGRNGMLFTSEGVINIRNKKWSNDFSPIDKMGTTFADDRFSKAYLRHLFVANEMLGPQLASLHNLGFYLWLVGQARQKIEDGTFKPWKEQMVKKLVQRL